MEKQGRSAARNVLRRSESAYLSMGEAWPGYTWMLSENDLNVRGLTNSSRISDKE